VFLSKLRKEGELLEFNVLLCRDLEEFAMLEFWWLPLWWRVGIDCKIPVGGDMQ